MVQDKVLSMLGLAAKAGKVTSGDFSVEKLLSGPKARLVILAEDASDNTQKRFKAKAAHAGCPVLVHGVKDALGRSIGKEARSIVAVTDEGLAAAIQQAGESLPISSKE